MALKGLIIGGKSSQLRYVYNAECKHFRFVLFYPIIESLIVKEYVSPDKKTNYQTKAIALKRYKYRLNALPVDSNVL